MRRSIWVLILLPIAVASACGSLSTSALEGKVKAAVVAQHGGRDTVSQVDCNDTPPPPDALPGGMETVHAEHTCTVTFSDGEPTQVWAVHVIDLIATHPVQLLYRVDHNASKPVPVNLVKAFAADMRILHSGHAVTAVRCRAASPPTPATWVVQTAPADHVCTARVSGDGPQRWAVRVADRNVQLLFTLS
jgi:hypothetical protein